MYPKELVKRRDQVKQANNKKQKSTFEVKDFFNALITLKTGIPDVIFIEQIEFLVQTMFLQMDDELIGYIYRFSSSITDSFHTNLTGVHEVFYSNHIGYGDDWKSSESFRYNEE